MSSAKNKKILLLASTGLIALSTMAVVLLGQDNAGLMSSKAAANLGRVVTVNESNRILNFFDNGNQYFTGAMFQLDDKLAYNYVYASQTQRPVFENHNNCILALWGDYGACYFTINFQYNTSKTFSLDYEQTNKITLAKFRHLTRIDITLDKGEGLDQYYRYTSLKSYKGSVESGTFTVLEDNASYVKYQWIPEGGFLVSDEAIDFKLAEGLEEHKAIWLTELTFYYDC